MLNLFVMSKYGNKSKENSDTSAAKPGIQANMLSEEAQNWKAEFYLENDQIKIGFSPFGGSIVSCQLKKYHQNFLDPKNNKQNYIIHNGLITTLIRNGLTSTPSFRLVKLTRNEIVFSHSGDGQAITKTYVLPASGYLIKQTVVVAPRTLEQVTTIKSFFEELNHTGENLNRLAVYLKDGKKSTIKSINDTVESPQWAGLATKYFLVAIIEPPNNPYNVRVNLENGQAKGLVLTKVAPEAVATEIYLGPKEYAVLKSAGYNLEKSMDLGWVILEPISLLMLNILNFIYGGIKNYGLAIIILTILIKLILWPLTQKSFKSMQEMQKIQPHLKKLQEKYKQEPDKLQPEMMKLYKEHGVNPLGGCLPSLLQLPIFFALFATLNNAIELRGSSFLWITDLSRPDTIFHLGPLPINLLPILMGLTMFWQQAQTTSSNTSDQTQKMMFYLMPVLMTVLFYGFPSGLTLYWFIFNLLTVLHQQLMINMSQGKT